MSGQKPHDSLFHRVFSEPASALDHFRRSLPPDVVAVVSWETLSLQPGSFVNDDLEQVHSDLLYQVSLVGGEELLLYVLFEHQARPEWSMALRVLDYQVRIWSDWQSRHPSARALPYIYPLLMYNGERNWNAPQRFNELLSAQYRSLFSPYTPACGYLLQDLSATSDEDLLGEVYRHLALLLFKHARKQDFWSRLPAWLHLFVELLSAPDGLARLRVLWRYILITTPRPAPEEVMAQIGTTLSETTRETLVTWAQQLREDGLQQGLQQGLRDGLQQGRAEALQRQRARLLRLLPLKFGELPKQVIDTIEAADEATLERIEEKMLLAQTLEEVMR